MLNIILHGCNGKMGKILQDIILNEPDMRVIAGIDKKIDEQVPFKLFISASECNVKGDVVIDFSHHTAIKDLLDYCIQTKTPTVIATTALSEYENQLIQEASRIIPVFNTANMSLGINVLSRMLTTGVPALEDAYNIEIIEKHHNKKTDSPSGTALLLANTINDACRTRKDYLYGRHSKSDQCKITDLGIHAIRGGSIPGEHTVIFAGPDEVIELTHIVYSKSVFARGALKAAAFIVSKDYGLYSMKDIV